MSEEPDWTVKEQDGLVRVGGKFAPGYSGNPGGRPRRKPITDAVLRIFDKLSLQEHEALLMPVIKKMATTGDVAAFTALRDTVEGKPAQQIAGDDDHPIRHVFAWEDEETQAVALEEPGT